MPISGLMIELRVRSAAFSPMYPDRGGSLVQHRQSEQRRARLVDTRVPAGGVSAR